MIDMSYFTTCENCAGELEGVGKYDDVEDKLHAQPCPNCGQEQVFSGWAEEEEEE